MKKDFGVQTCLRKLIISIAEAIIPYLVYMTSLGCLRVTLHCHILHIHLRFSMVYGAPDVSMWRVFEGYHTVKSTTAHVHMAGTIS